MSCCHDKSAVGAMLQKMMYRPWSRHYVQIKIMRARTFIIAHKLLVWGGGGWLDQECSTLSLHITVSNQYHSLVWTVERKPESTQLDYLGLPYLVSICWRTCIIHKRARILWTVTLMRWCFQMLTDYKQLFCLLIRWGETHKQMANLNRKTYRKHWCCGCCRQWAWAWTCSGEAPLRQ